MKKVILILMLFVGMIASADWEAVASGEDKEGATNYSYPGIVVFHDNTDGKYDIYRFTMGHGYFVYKGDIFTKEDLNRKGTKAPLHVILIHKGKKCINLSQEEVMKILKEIEFKETDLEPQS